MGSNAENQEVATPGIHPYSSTGPIHQSPTISNHTISNHIHQPKNPTVTWPNSVSLRLLNSVAQWEHGSRTIRERHRNTFKDTGWDPSLDLAKNAIFGRKPRAIKWCSDTKGLLQVKIVKQDVFGFGCLPSLQISSLKQSTLGVGLHHTSTSHFKSFSHQHN